MHVAAVKIFFMFLLFWENLYAYTESFLRDFVTKTSYDFYIILKTKKYLKGDK